MISTNEQEVILTDEQEKALKIILNKHKNHEKYVTICGYAGVGKSTLVKFAVKALDVAEDRVAYACFCGKAAEVLRKKGNKNAMTLHRLLYDSRPKKGGGFYRTPKSHLEYDIVIVDEISLAPRSMIELLLSHKVFCIFIGDSFQLPQIDKNEAHDYLNHPDVFLSKIMRQAEESEIIRLTMKIRNKEPILYSKGNEVLILPKEEFSTSHLLWADSVICGTNATRHSLNQQMRELHGFSGELQEGEKVICKRNYWEDLDENGDALVNGTIGKISNISEDYITIPGYIENDRHRIPILRGDIISETDGTFMSVNIDKDFLINEAPCVEWRVAYQMGKARLGDLLPRQITYGYSLTAHASQGSEWDKVLVVEERFPYDKTEHARWLYTAATRASEKLVIVR